ncbi:hypothetical protein Tco_0212476 [Tanacetum coccineum]
MPVSNKKRQLPQILNVYVRSSTGDVVERRTIKGAMGRFCMDSKQSGELRQNEKEEDAELVIRCKQSKTCLLSYAQEEGLLILKNHLLQPDALIPRKALLEGYSSLVIKPCKLDVKETNCTAIVLQQGRGPKRQRCEIRGWKYNSVKVRVRSCAIGAELAGSGGSGFSEDERGITTDDGFQNSGGNRYPRQERNSCFA